MLHHTRCLEGFHLFFFWNDFFLSTAVTTRTQRVHGSSPELYCPYHYFTIQFLSIILSWIVLKLKIILFKVSSHFDVSMGDCLSSNNFRYLVLFSQAARGTSPSLPPKYVFDVKLKTCSGVTCKDEYTGSWKSASLWQAEQFTFCIALIVRILIRTWTKIESNGYCHWTNSSTSVCHKSSTTFWSVMFHSGSEVSCFTIMLGK